MLAYPRSTAISLSFAANHLHTLISRAPNNKQVIGRPLGEDAMLRVAYALEGQLNFASQVPDRVREARS